MLKTLSKLDILQANIMLEKSIPNITVLIPTYNEEQGIGPTIEDLKNAVDFESLIVVDGNSTDRTAEIAEKMGAQILFQEGNGKGLALAQVINHVTSGTEYVVLTDADYTYPAESIPEMIRIMENHPEIGMVIGNRFHSKLFYARGRKVISDILLFGNRILSFAHFLVNGIKLMDPLSGLRLIRWEAIKDWKPKSIGFDIEVEMNYYIRKQGYRTVEIPILYRPRLGAKKLRISDAFTILKRILVESILP
jgi:dolichol-phosphate mannosyltransferase